MNDASSLTVLRRPCGVNGKLLGIEADRRRLDELFDPGYRGGVSLDLGVAHALPRRVCDGYVESHSSPEFHRCYHQHDEQQEHKGELDEGAAPLIRCSPPRTPMGRHESSEADCGSTRRQTF